MNKYHKQREYKNVKPRLKSLSRQPITELKRINIDNSKLSYEMLLDIIEKLFNEIDGFLNGSGIYQQDQTIIQREERLDNELEKLRRIFKG